MTVMKMKIFMEEEGKMWTIKQVHGKEGKMTESENIILSKICIIHALFWKLDTFDVGKDIYSDRCKWYSSSHLKVANEI